MGGEACKVPAQYVADVISIIEIACCLSARFKALHTFPLAYCLRIIAIREGQVAHLLESGAKIYLDDFTDLGQSKFRYELKDGI